jgi:hypothetical protein
LKALLFSCETCQCYRQPSPTVQGDRCPICRSPMSRTRLKVQATPREVTKTRLRLLAGRDDLHDSGVTVKGA